MTTDNETRIGELEGTGGEQIADELRRQETRAILFGVLAAVGWALFFGAVVAMGIK